MIDAISHRYGERPSTFFEIENPIVALDFDLSVMIMSDYYKMELQKESKKETPQEELERLISQFNAVRSLSQ